MFKASLPCKYHRNVFFVAGFYGFEVTFTSAGLDDRGDALSYPHVDSVPEREESVRDHYRARQPALVLFDLAFDLVYLRDKLLCFGAVGLLRLEL